jgi:hypothetical protein
MFREGSHLRGCAKLQSELGDQLAGLVDRAKSLLPLPSALKQHQERYADGLTPCRYPNDRLVFAGYDPPRESLPTGSRNFGVGGRLVPVFPAFITLYRLD